MSRRLSIIDLTSGLVPASPHRQFSSDTTSIRSNSDSPDYPRPTEQATSRGTKRRRDRDDTGSPGPSSRPRREEPIQSIDLTEVDSSSELAQTLSNLREDAVKAQQPTEIEETRPRSILGAYKCPVCMDTPEDATSTACGHLFCHRCILECLATADARNLDSNKNKGTCPVCRKSLTKADTHIPGRQRMLIPLKLKLTTKKWNMVPPTEA